MRKIGWITAGLAVLLAASTVGWYRFYRVPPPPNYPFDFAGHRKRVDRAGSLFCSEWAERPVSRMVVIELIPQTTQARPLIAINDDREATWSDALELLKSIYSTRADRVLFLVDNQDVDQRYRSELMSLLRQTPWINAVCVIDPKNPPSWYPLPKIQMPAVAAR